MRLKAMIVLIVVMMMVFTLGFAGCGEEDDGERVTVKVGLTAPLSGPGGGYGRDIKAGLDMAVAAVNEAGGLTIGDTNYRFELMASDDEASPEGALSNVQRFILQEDINIVWDPFATTIRALMGINEKAGEEFLIMSYTSVPLYADSPNSLMVTLPPPFYNYMEPFIAYCMGNGWMRLGMLQITGAYGELWGSIMKTAWTGAGGQVVSEAPASYYTVTDFTPYITTVLAGNPDVILVGGPSEPTALVMDQARSLGFEGGFIVMDQAKLDWIEEVIGIEKMEGAIGVSPVAVQAANYPYIDEFMKRYADEYGGQLVTWETIICYTGFHIMVRAMEAAGSVTDVEAIRAAFADAGVAVTSGDEFPMGFEGFDNTTGALWMPATPAHVEGGEYVLGESMPWWEQ
jgi:branched-chain amino acid transport system substrate-binding protein